MESGNEEERGGERRKEKRNHHPKAYDFFSASAASYGKIFITRYSILFFEFHDLVLYIRVFNL